MWHRQHPLPRTVIFLIFAVTWLSACAAPTSPISQADTSAAASPTVTSSGAATPDMAQTPGATASATSRPLEPTASAAPSASSTPSTTPAPDNSSQIVYVRYDVAQQRAELHRVGMDGRDDRVMALAPAGCDILGLAVAPSADLIAYSVGGCPTPGLHLINADGSDDRVLLNELTQVGGQAFSPDSTRLAFTHYRELSSAPVPQSTIALIDVRGGEPQQLTPWGTFFGQPAWRNATQLVYSQAAIGTPPANWTTYALEASPDATPEAIRAGQLIAVSPDRTALLLALETNQMGSEAVRLALQPLDGAESRLLDDQAGPLPRVAWAPDGTTLAVTDWNARNIALLDIESARRSPIAAIDPMAMVDVRLAWDSADKRLVYSTGGADGPTLHLFDVANNADRVIMPLPSAATFLAVSAGGEPQAAMRPLEQEQLRICVATAHGPLKPGILETLRDTVLNQVAQRRDFQQWNSTLFNGAEPSIEEGCPGPMTILSPDWSGSGTKEGAPYRVITPSPYFVWIFLVEDHEAQQAFGTEFPRRTPQEMLCEGHDCAESNSAIYLTPAEVQQQDRVVRSLLWALGFEA